MLFKAITILLVAGTTLAHPMDPHLETNAKLIDFMMMSRAGNTAQQQYCFDTYMPQLKEITNKLESDYEVCNNAYNTGKAGVDKEFFENRQNITAIAKNSCAALQVCDGMEDFDKSFRCFGSNAADQSRILLIMSGDSNQQADDIALRYASIENTRSSCFNEAHRCYSEDTDETYATMKKCMADAN